MRQADVGELKRLLKTLPQELYDDIFALTFTASGQVETISEGWIPPHLFSISSATRAHFAASYFSSSSRFQFRLTDVVEDSKYVVKWVRAFSHHDIAAVEDIKYVRRGRCLNTWDQMARQIEKTYLAGRMDHWARMLRLGDEGKDVVREVAKKIEVLVADEAEEMRPFGCWA